MNKLTSSFKHKDFSIRVSSESHVDICQGAETAATDDIIKFTMI
jgi:hypothetical protein